MSKRKDFELLSDIKEAIRRIRLYLNRLSYERFMEREESQDAVVRNLEIIGEAAKNLSTHLKKGYANIPWKELAGLRDRLVHQYFGVNLDIVWRIVNQELPELTKQIEEILEILLRKAQ
ncbi:MAG TPA: DUF86 domain-containing protein [Candidatus Omnitrophota bacterium]|nr:DUF86 domain-containing protein [Candidatus Omnitrophota bacterium]